MQFRSVTFRFLLLALLVGLFAGIVLLTAPPAAAQDNLLQNPGFEGNYSAWLPQYGTAQMAANWTPWWIEDGSRSPVWAQPEYKPAERQFFPNRVLEGDRSQQYFTFYKSHYAGMYQQVFGVTPGQTYRFLVWTQVWSSTEVSGDASVNPANPRLYIGIDPTGAAWPGAVGGTPPTVVWSGEVSMTCVIDNWCPVSLDVTAQNDVITVYIRSSPDFANIHNDLYFDAASLTLVGPPPPPTATPTNTPGPATNTPVPTATPIATNTPAATNTPEATNTPVATSTPLPTATPLPTETPVPTEPPTATPLPTSTPVPEETQPPTNTPPPAATPTDAASAETPIAQPTAQAVAEVATPAATPPESGGEDSAETNAASDNSTLFGIGMIAAGVLILAGLVGVLLVRRA